jgi:hypothetical protein
VDPYSGTVSKALVVVSGVVLVVLVVVTGGVKVEDVVEVSFV